MAQFKAVNGRKINFVQDNHYRSIKGVLRGLHCQIQQPQGKLVHIVVGGVFDVAVDIRKSSPTFGKWVGEILSADNKKQIWVLVGLAQDFDVLSDNAARLDKTTDYWAPEYERCIAWNDGSLVSTGPSRASPCFPVKMRNAPRSKQQKDIHDEPLPDPHSRCMG